MADQIKANIAGCSNAAKEHFDVLLTQLQLVTGPNNIVTLGAARTTLQGLAELVRQIDSSLVDLFGEFAKQIATLAPQMDANVQIIVATGVHAHQSVHAQQPARPVPAAAQSVLQAAAASAAAPKLTRAEKNAAYKQRQAEKAAAATVSAAAPKPNLCIADNDLVLKTDDDDEVAQVAAEPAAQTTPTVAAATWANGANAIRSAAAAAAKQPEIAVQAATGDFQHAPRVGALDDLGNGYMAKLVTGSAPQPGRITKLAPHHFALMLPGIGAPITLHTSGLGVSSESLRTYTQVQDPALPRNPNFFANPFDSTGAGTGSSIVRCMPRAILLGGKRADCNLPCTVVALNLKNAAGLRASARELSGSDFENLKQIVAFFVMLLAAVDHEQGTKV